MAVSYVDRTTNTSASNPISTAKPTGLVEGDLLIALLGNSSNDGTTWTAPDGFSNLHNSSSNDGSINLSVQIFWKVATSVDVSASTFSFTGSTGGNCSLTLFAIRGASGNTPQINTNRVAANNTVTTTGLTPTANNLLVLATIYADNDVSTSLTNASYAITNNNPTWTEQQDNIAFGLDVGTAFATASRPESTATGTTTVVATPDSGTVDIYFQAIIAFAPGAYTVSVTGASAVVGTGSASLSRQINLINNTAKTSTTFNNTARP